jgi:hypothetical protein
MSTPMRFLVTTLPLVPLILLVACTESEPGDESTPTPAPLGAHPPQYSTAVQLTAGEYKSPAGYPEARDKGAEAEQAEAGKPPFEGIINGIEFRPAGAGTLLDYCGDDDFIGFQETQDINHQYLPPGTKALSPLYAAVCPDETRPVIGQEFAGYNFSFEVFWYGQRVFRHEASEDRVSETTIGQSPGVAIAPLTSDGYGSSAITWPSPNGMIAVTALDLPFDQLRKVAEGVRCDVC